MAADNLYRTMHPLHEKINLSIPKGKRYQNTLSLLSPSPWGRSGWGSSNALSFAAEGFDTETLPMNSLFGINAVILCYTIPANRQPHNSFLNMEAFFAKNALYVVLLVTLTVWTGIAFYVNRLESKVTSLERKSGS